MKVYVLSINNGEGASISLHVDKSHAKTGLTNYVSDYWGDTVGESEGLMPDDADLATDMYFDYMDGQEWHSIEVKTLDIDPPKPALEDEVELNELELEATVSSLQSTIENLAKLGADVDLGEADKELHTLILKNMESAYEKLRD